MVGVEMPKITAQIIRDQEVNFSFVGYAVGLVAYPLVTYVSGVPQRVKEVHFVISSVDLRHRNSKNCPVNQYQTQYIGNQFRSPWYRYIHNRWPRTVIILFKNVV